MKYYTLFDQLSPEGDLYKVDETTGQAWLVDSAGREPIAAFVTAAAFHGTTQFAQLEDYARKYGRLEEA